MALKWLTEKYTFQHLIDVLTVVSNPVLIVYRAIVVSNTILCDIDRHIVVGIFNIVENSSESFRVYPQPC